MHFSHVHTRVATMLSCSVLILGCALAGTAHAAANTYCSPGQTTTYDGPNNGQWGTGDDWTNGQPTAQCDAVIPANTTVTLSTVTQQGTYGNGNGSATQGLTLNSGATVIVEGISSDVQGNWSNQTDLSVGADGLTIDSGATIDLQATGNTAQATNGAAPGGSANLSIDSGASGPANATNNGSIVASSSDGSWGESLNDGGTFTNNGSITDQSGLLTLQGQGNTFYDFNNAGSMTIDSGASFKMIAGDGSDFNNTGTFANQGTATLQQSMYWEQNGGGETGNPVQFTDGGTLQDASGGGSFEVTNCTTTGLIGTVPATQTISVNGGCSGTTLYDGGKGTATVVNDGTIDLVAPAGGSDGILAGSELDNHGTLNSTVGGALPLANQLLVPLVNESGATVNLSGGELQQTTGSTTTNAGTVKLGPGATWLVQAGAFTNTGTLAPQIAGATNLGTVNLTVGSKFNAGGTLAPALVSGYQPAAGTEFPIVTMNGGSPSGTFASVTGGFSADYGKETASTPYLGIVYGGAASGGGGSGGGGGGGGTSGGGTSGSPRPSVESLAGGAGRLVLKLACARSAKSACAYTSTASVGKTKVAGGHGTVKPGKSVTLTLKLNKAGTALLKKRHRLRVKLLVSTGGKTLKSSTVTVTKAVKGKK